MLVIDERAMENSSKFSKHFETVNTGTVVGWVEQPHVELGERERDSSKP